MLCLRTKKGDFKYTFLSLLISVFVSVPRRYFFCGSFMCFFCLVFAMPLYAHLFICALWSPAGERADLLALVCGV